MVEQIGAVLDPSPMYHWSTHQGAELDLYFEIEGRGYGIEIKRSSAPRLTKSMRIAVDDLGLAHVGVVYPGTKRVRLPPRVMLVPVSELAAVTTPSELAAILDAN